MITSVMDDMVYCQGQKITLQALFDTHTFADDGSPCGVEEVRHCE
jgi:hypothetical protein